MAPTVTRSRRDLTAPNVRLCARFSGRDDATCSSNSQGRAGALLHPHLGGIGLRRGGRPLHPHCAAAHS